MFVSKYIYIETTGFSSVELLSYHAVPSCMAFQITLCHTFYARIRSRLKCVDFY